MAASPIMLSYNPQPPGSRVSLFETEGSLTLAFPPMGIRSQLWSWSSLLIFVFLPLLHLGVSGYMLWRIRAMTGFAIPIPWAAWLLPFAFSITLYFVLAWWIGAMGAEVVLQPGKLRVRRYGRFLDRTREWPAEQIKRIGAPRFSGITILDSRGKLLTRVKGYSSRADQLWVAAKIREGLGLAEAAA